MYTMCRGNTLFFYVLPAAGLFRHRQVCSLCSFTLLFPLLFPLQLYFAA